MNRAYLIDLGTMAYQEAHHFQTDCLEWRLNEKNGTDLFLIVDHMPVFTLGKRGGRESLTVAESFVKSKGVDIVQTERGGDITYHGPGQLVVYPIVHLRQAKLSVASYVELLEEVMIATVAEVGVEANRDERNRGLWVGNNKIGSIGIRVRHGVVFHGLALNVSIDFEHFNWIQPCGLSGVGVTSVARELGHPVDFSAVKEMMIRHLSLLFGREFTRVSTSFVSGDGV